MCPPSAAQRRLSLVVGTRSPSVLEEVRAVFAPAGWTVEGAVDATALRNACEQKVPTLLLLAFDEADSDAIVLCRELCRLPQKPVVLIACNDPGEEVLYLARSAGAAEVLSRPVRGALLLDRVTRLLRAAQVDERLSRELASLQSLERVAQIGTWTLDADGGPMEWSDQMFSLLGLERGVPTDFESFSLCMHPDDRENTIAALRDSMRGAKVFSVQHRVVLPNGAVRHVQLRGEVSADDPSKLRGAMQDVTEQRRAQEKIRFLAQFDSLTGLSNRRRFMEQVERARARAEADSYKMALLYLDLDQFKRINDTLGHSAGDELLRSVADRLFERVRITDVVGRAPTTKGSEISRLGGDEFAILLTRISSGEDAALVAERILVALPTPIEVEGHEISTTGSIGISVYPDHGRDVETLVKHADRALYHAKEKGRNNHQFFSDALNAGALQRLRMEARLRAAVADETMRLCYQPRLDLASGRIEAAEALLRWKDSELGQVPPKQFIPIAEETGLIVPLGSWVIRAACEQGVKWDAAGFEPIRVSVNVSTEQFRRDDLIATVAEALEVSGFDPHRLELEITESLMLQDDEETAKLLRELRAMGLRIALDDFGTGYSSLSYLARYPLDVLKLDRSLVRDLTDDPNAQGIAKAVISMAHVLGLRVVAEGVDQQEQLDFLKEQGCDEMQGFLFAPALEAEDLSERLARKGQRAEDAAPPEPESEESVPLLALKGADSKLVA